MGESKTTMRINDQRGIALIAVLGFLAVMSLIAIGVVSVARTTVENASRHLLRAQAQAAIESGIDYGANTLASARGTVPALLSMPETIEIGGFRVKISARSERGKVDLNFADASLLEAVFRAGGAGKEQAQALSAAVEDWRDGDDLLHLNGAERRQYEDAGLSYGPANKFFAAVGELRLLLGMTDRIFNCVRPQLTVLTQAPGIEVEAASPMMKRAMGIETALGSSPGQVASVLSNRLIAPGDVYEVSAELEDSKQKIRRSERVSVRLTGNPSDPTWSLHIEAATPSDEAAKIACPPQFDRGDS